jgi:hypothetical protein
VGCHDDLLRCSKGFGDFAALRAKAGFTDHCALPDTLRGGPVRAGRRIYASSGGWCAFSGAVSSTRAAAGCAAA